MRRLNALNEPATILSSAARTESGTSSEYRMAPGLKALFFLLDVTAAATDAGDSLNVYIQESPDGGTTWNDIASFAQFVGNSAAANQLAVINCEAAAENEIGATKDGALAAGSVRQGPAASYLRAKYVIVDSGDGDQGFTFSIVMMAVR